MKRIRWTRVAALLLALTPAAAGAQDERRLTDQAAEDLAAFFNRPSTSRVAGPARIAAGTEVAGDLAALGGPLVLAGTVRGDVVVINGSVRLEPGAVVAGTLTVVGGAVAGEIGVVAGGVTVYAEALRFRREGDRIVALPPLGDRLLSQATWFGRGEFIVGVEGGYNRVEGLPITLGPRLEFGRSNPTVFEGRIIYRTGNGLQFHPDEMGHDLRLEQYLGGFRAFKVGIGWYRLTEPIEPRGVSDTENSLSTFILHRDLRDHYARVGGRAWFEFADRTRPLRAGIEYRDERQQSAGTRTPWTLLHNNDDWRPQPQVADGDIRLLIGWFRWDSRNDPVDPSAGWLLHTELEQGLEGDLTEYRADPADPAQLVFRPVHAEYTALRIDARRYQRLGPRTRIALRALAAGSPDDSPLPPQRQHVLGGEGSLPGYTQFAFDCGARGQPIVNGLFPYYGCDRLALFQGELRYAFLGAGGISLGRRLGLDFELATTPELVIFGNAGRVWIEPESVGDRGDPGPADFRYDAGIGLRLGRIGLYFAVPLAGRGAGNFFVRLGPRI